MKCCLNPYGWRETHNALIMLVLCSSFKENAHNYTNKFGKNIQWRHCRLKYAQIRAHLTICGELVSSYKCGAIIVVYDQLWWSVVRNTIHLRWQRLYMRSNIEIIQFAIYVITWNKHTNEFSHNVETSRPFSFYSFKIALRSCTEHFRHNNVMSFRRRIPRDFHNFWQCGWSSRH